ncbi:unnamed protein product [Arctia plantaginis]|uniref:receptor protein-tyrosine kinase n=1 Tax=Arctia plantaginis TaxID=874455 RepID=A0A8S1AKS8_ARCPL|nr:unnamed protein product [Arctia plantaginis]
MILNILCLKLIFIGFAQCQTMNVTLTGTGMCLGGNFKNVIELKKHVQHCVVIVGYLELAFRARNNFTGVQFDNLREITDYLVVYNAIGLESVGQLFPALTRIRGNKLLFNNYALVVHDNPNLREVALFNLIKIDQGGVIIWGSPQACYVNTIDWKVLTPKGRHLISPSEGQVECNVPCFCTSYKPKNRCWNNKKCQIFIEDEQCDNQCLGCRKTKKIECFTCQYYTFKFDCVFKCPVGTFVQTDSQYCLSKEECHEFGGFVWNSTCITECPEDYLLSNKTVESTCEPYSGREMNCSSLTIQYSWDIQNAENCVYINGALILRLRYVLDAMDQLKKYLNKIEEVSDFIVIESSDVITSLDFMSSLRVIKGNKLKDGKYSLYIYNNNYLQTLFTPEVTKNLQIKNGTASFQRNPILCMSFIDEIKSRFPTQPNDLDIFIGTNGYRGGCKEVRFNFTITANSDTTVKVSFSIEDYNTHYTALYARLKPGVQSKAVPENYCEIEWRDADITTISGKSFCIVELKDLVPASTYAFCVEIFNPKKVQLSRSNTVNFTTPIGTPEPPFILQLVASSSNLVVLRWTDHKNYIAHIKSYELDVELLEMNPRESMVDYCKYNDDFFEEDDIRHAIVRKPPAAYKRDCESKCGILSSVPPGVMAEEYFEVCDEHFSCNYSEESVIVNSSISKNYVRTLALKLDGPRNDFQVGGLAPFSDYRFRLRSCVDRKCSRSARGIVRTFRAKNADVISNISGHADGSGTVTVKWKSPEITNGPILSYSVEILPRININNILPHVVCVRANETEIVVKSVIISKYLVKVCLKTLASSRNCSDWVIVTADHIPIPPSPHTSKMQILWTGVLCGILMYIATFLAVWLKSHRRIQSDTIPLVDSLSSCRVESDAPALMLSDFVTFHTMSLE